MSKMAEFYAETGEHLIAVAPDVAPPPNLNVGERQAWEAAIVELIATFSCLDRADVVDGLERERDRRRIAGPLASLERAYAA